ncbi:hypothetical protein D3C76_1749890 [compost metagenome]
MPGIFTSRGFNEPRTTTRSTWAITRPPELRAAMAMARLSMVSASRSMDRLPSSSALVARITPTWIGKLL